MATRADEPAVREFLRTNALGGWVRLAFQREPDAFAATFGLAESHDFIIVYDESTGRAMGGCERFVRDAWVNGEVARLPYLGSLRVNSDFRNRIRHLRMGFRAVRELLADPRDLKFSLTAITADNDAARRLLCAGIAGLPQYLPVGEMCTFAIRPHRARHDARIELATKADLPAIADLLQRVYRNYQFAPVWRAEHLQRLDASGALPASSYLITRRDGRIVACVALWDQTSVKQTLICGYSKSVEAARPLLNLVAPILGTPRLPRPGATLKQVYLSHLAVADESAEDFAALLRAALSVAHEKGFEVAVLGLAREHALTSVVQREWKSREYRALLHIVQWPEEATWRESVPRPVSHPEIALM